MPSQNLTVHEHAPNREIDRQLSFTDRAPAKYITNLYLAMKHFVWGGADELTILHFQCKLAWKLIKNPLLTEQRPDLIATRCCTNSLVVHNVAKCPPFTSRWNGHMFEMTSQLRYSQFTCKSRGCKKRVRTYCVCTPGEWSCSSHWCAHFLEAAAISFVGN